MEEGALADQGALELALVDGAGGGDVAARDDGLVCLVDAHRAAGLGQLQVDLKVVPERGQRLRRHHALRWAATQGHERSGDRAV